jgi:GNAT superfamily N-acetyltransferase
VSQRRGTETLIVARAHRRRGHGRALMAAATEYAPCAARSSCFHGGPATTTPNGSGALGYRTISQVLGTDL